MGVSFILGKADSIPPGQAELIIQSAQTLRLSHPDSAREVLESVRARALRDEDTLIAAKAMMALAQVYGHQANYKESYDQLWTALLLADAANLSLTTSSIYRALGRYYSFYNRKNHALKFLKTSLDLKKKLVREGTIHRSGLVVNYLAFCSTYRELDEDDMCQVYLDSCLMYRDTELSQLYHAFLEFEQAVLLNKKQQYQEAEKGFLKILPWFKQHNPGYQVLVYHYMGNSYKELGNFEKSEDCYQKALNISETYHSHLDFTPLVYGQLAELYNEQGDLGAAYQSLYKFKKLDEKFFDSRSENNRPLLEIQDAFRIEKEEKEQWYQKQRLAQLEQEDKVLLLQRTILIGSLIFLIVLGIIYLNVVRARHRREKELMQKKQELEIQKTQEIVELKNKELAASVLKLIEKEAFIDSLKETLSGGKGEIKRQEVIQLVQSQSNGSIDTWKEFEARFVSVNKTFYEKLTRQFPRLTQGDLKLCALVKLNFSSKEMAKLMGISVESVHTTRHRLRKKLNLSRDINLTEFIANF